MNWEDELRKINGIGVVSKMRLVPFISSLLKKQRENEIFPILIKAGDTRLKISGFPLEVDCRIIAEELYQKMYSVYIKCQ